MTDAHARAAARVAPWLLTGAVFSLALIPPFVSDGLGDFLRAGFSLVCHQIPERSFNVMGDPLAVCHRCIGIYAGLFLASLLFTVIRRWDRLIMRRVGIVILLSLVPMGVDWMAGLSGLWESSAATRVLTGVAFGAIAGYLFARALREVICDLARPSTEGDLVSQS